MSRLVYDRWRDWPQAPTVGRTPSRFEANWTPTLRLLEREVEALGCRDEIVLQVGGIPQGGVRVDGTLRANARITEPGVIVSFDSRHGPLRYLTDQFCDSDYGNGSRFLPGWQANVRAIALSLEALRKVDRYGVAGRGEQYVGWKQLGAGTPLGPPQPMTVDEAARVLLVGADMRPTPALVDEALAGGTEFVGMLYRVAARQHHPDAGGNAETFRKITEARDLLVSQAKGST